MPSHIVLQFQPVYAICYSCCFEQKKKYNTIFLFIFLRTMFALIHPHNKKKSAVRAHSNRRTAAVLLVEYANPTTHNSYVDDWHAIESEYSSACALSTVHWLCGSCNQKLMARRRTKTTQQRDDNKCIHNIQIAIN